MHDDTFSTKMMQQTANLQSKGQKQGGLGTRVEVLEQETMPKKLHQLVSRRELVDKVSLY